MPTSIRTGKAMAEKDTEALGGILSSMMANPKLMEALSSLMQPSAATGVGARERATEKAVTEETAAGGPALDIASMLSSVSPEAIAALPNVVSMLSPLFHKEEAKSEEKPPTAEAFAALVPSKHGGGSGEHIHLLLALKPYVSNGRKDMIDNIIRVSRFADVIRRMGGIF